MSNPRKPARLWLRKREGRQAIWAIVRGKTETSTGCLEHDIEGADEAFRDWLVENAAFDTEERRLDKIYIAEVLALYATQIAPKLSSRETIGYHIKALKPFWGEKTLADIRGSNCRKYEVSRPVKPSTVRRELKTLQAAINHWHKESALPAVPKVTLPDEAPPRDDFLERKEVAALLRAARKRKLSHVIRYILIGFYTGTRRTAILRLRYSKSLSGGYIDFERRILYRRGIGERETSKRRPPVQIPARLFGFLQRWKRQDADNHISHIVHRNGKAIKKIDSRTVKRLAKDASLGQAFVMHILRHTCSTHALNAGKSPWEVAGIIGATADMVDKVYGHHFKEARKRA